MLSLAVTRAKEGDAQAFAFLYASYAEHVHGYARSIVRDRDDAQDITRQVFAKLLRVIGKYQERDVPFSAWMIRVTQLPSGQREVLLLRHLSGLSPGEIPIRTGRSESSVHGLHPRGRRALTAELTIRGAAPAAGRPQAAGLRGA